jgi:hypothetical protein
MSPALLLPAGLAALAALALPLLIHIARASEQRPIDFAALRWLRQKPRPRHRLRFDEWALLALRVLLLALLALWLARPVLFDDSDKAARVLVAPGADPAAAAAIVQTDPAPRWLAPGFPPLDRAPPAGPLPLASLLRQIDAETPPGARLTIVVPATFDGADAERPILSREVDWQIVPGTTPPYVPARPADPPRLTILHAADHAADLRYFRAAAIAWRAPPPVVAPAGSPIPVDTRILLWLAAGPVPRAVTDWVTRGGTALLGADATVALPGASVYWRADDGTPLVEGAGLGQGRMLRLTQPLKPAAMPQLLDPAFPDRLRALFDPPAPPPGRVMARDYRPGTGAAAFPQPARELRSWLALLIAALFAGERWLATRRGRGVAP